MSNEEFFFTEHTTFDESFPMEFSQEQLLNFLQSNESLISKETEFFFDPNSQNNVWEKPELMQHPELKSDISQEVFPHAINFQPPHFLEANSSPFSPVIPGVNLPLSQQNRPNPLQETLEDMKEQELIQEQQIRKLIDSQRQLMIQPSEDLFRSITNEENLLKQKIENQLGILEKTFGTEIFDPSSLSEFHKLKQTLQIQMKQIELLFLEAQQLVKGSISPHCLAALVITKQPFPLVISKMKQIPEDQLQVKLISSSNLHIQSVTPVKAVVMSDSTSRSGRMIEGDSQNFDPHSKIAKFPLKFITGTKKSLASIKFGMQIQLHNGPHPLTVESNSSEYFIVITNECQWEGSAGNLLKKEAFSNQLEVSWPKLANTIQCHIIKATRQALSDPRRFLSRYDLNYIHKKFFNGKNLITQKDFDVFWHWFGKALQKLRYQRHIGSLWQNRILYGFMSREGVENALQGNAPGTCIVRFSESHGGQFAISYIDPKTSYKIKHYLMQPNDTASAKKTLADFLYEQPQFQSILVLNEDCHGDPLFTPLPKSQALENYVQPSKSMAQETAKGYDPLT